MIEHLGKQRGWLALLLLALLCTRQMVMAKSQPFSDPKPDGSVETERLAGSLPASIDQFRIHGLGSFNTLAKNKLRKWLSFGVNATRTTLGVYPHPLELFVYSRPSNQPVPWAHTRRDAQESVHFYVDSRFTADEFIQDWTIYHELAHLAIPFIGEEYAWLSEGFASYMQYQIMQRQGLLKVPLQEAYRLKIEPQLARFQVKITAAAMAQGLMEKHQYPAAYWGGCWFWLLADRQLHEAHQPALIDLISRYQQQGRAIDTSVKALMSSLDALAGSLLFTDLLNQFERAPARELYPLQFDPSSNLGTSLPQHVQ